MYEDEYIAGDRITLKIVGQDSYSEANDFRLYPTAIACQAYEYLFLRANATGQNELGAYLTNVGVVIGPNALGSSGNYRFRTWGGQLGYRNPVLYTTNYASLPINGMMHTHPGGTSTPSPEDTQELAARFDVPQYIIAGLSIYQFTANGTSTAVASYYDRDCQ